MPVEPNAAKDFFTMLTDLLGAAGTIGAALVGWCALGTWRDQIRGQATFDAAKRLVIAANTLAMRFHNARAPLIETSEFPDEFNVERNPSRAQLSEAHTKVFNKRWQPVGVAYNDVLALLPEARAFFEADVADAVEAFLLVARELSFYMDEYAGLLKYDLDNMERGPARDQLREQLRVATQGVFAPYPRAGVEVRNDFTVRLSEKHLDVARRLKPFLHLN